MENNDLSCFFLFKEGKKLSYDDFDRLKEKLSEESKKVIAQNNKALHCDLRGWFMSVHAPEDTILDLVQNSAEILTDMGYIPDLVSRDFQSGTLKDWQFLQTAIVFSKSFFEARKKEILANHCTCMIIDGIMVRGMQGTKLDKKICDKKEEEHFFVK